MKGIGLALLVLLGAGAPLCADGKKAPDPARAQSIDLATALRLAGAQNLEVRLAAEAATLAQTESALAQEAFFPWISVGGGYTGHRGNIQAVNGPIINGDKSARLLAGTVKAQLDLGETYFRTLSAWQLAKAAAFASETQRAEAALQAALAYLDLVLAQSSVGVALDAVQISQGYETQVRRAVEAGLAFSGDAFRIQAQLEQNRLGYRHALEVRRIAAARLAQVLQLDPVVNLLPEDAAPAPLAMVSAAASLDSFVQCALLHRPELQRSAAEREAARRFRDGAKYGPLAPTLTGQYSYGGLAGGAGSEVGNFDGYSDYGVGLSWRLGPGGLFDGARIEASESRLRTTELEAQRLREEIVRQVVEAHTRVRSLGDQIGMARRALTAAQKSLDLSIQRKEFGVGIVAETIQSEQDLTRARREYLASVAEYDKAQFTLQRATGVPAKGR